MSRILDLSVIRDAAGNGQGAVAIARLAGCLPKTVRSLARRHGIKLIEERVNYTRDQDETIRTMAAAGRSVAEIAKYLGREPGTVRSRARKLGIELAKSAAPTYTQEELAVVRKLVRQGAGRRKIAEALGRRSPNGIDRQIAKLGLRYRQTKKPADPKLQLRLDPALHEKVVAAAGQQGISPAALAREVVRQSFYKPDEPARPPSPPIMFLMLQPQLIGRI
jgi:hypothetical protein